MSSFFDALVAHQRDDAYTFLSEDTQRRIRLGPARRRDAVAHLIKKFRVSERRACRLVGQHRSTNRYVVRPAELETKLVARMTVLGEQHPRWGYRMIHGLLVEEGWPVNNKRIERLWRQEGLQVPPQRLKASGQKAREGQWPSRTATSSGSTGRCARAAQR